MRFDDIPDSIDAKVFHEFLKSIGLDTEKIYIESIEFKPNGIYVEFEALSPAGIAQADSRGPKAGVALHRLYIPFKWKVPFKDDRKL